MRIGEREIGDGHPPYVIAEIGVNHDGEVGRALELTDAAAEAGADAVKLQYFETDRLMSRAAKLAAYQKAAGETDPVEMLRRLELSLDECAKVVDRAHAKGVHAIVTVFSLEHVKPASGLGWDAFKTASPDLINKPLQLAIKKLRKPMIISTGAADPVFLDMSLEWMGKTKDRLAYLQCVSSYPTPPELASLGGMVWMRDTLAFSYGKKHRGAVVGYSDHTDAADTGALAVQAGAAILEKHLTYSTSAKGPDHAASLEPDGFLEYVQLAKAARVHPAVLEPRSPLLLMGLFKAREAPHELSARKLETLLFATDERFGGYMKESQEIEDDVLEASRQSLVARMDLAAGLKLKKEHLTIKRPGTGMWPSQLGFALGKRLARPVEADTPLVEEDLAG